MNPGLPHKTHENSTIAAPRTLRKYKEHPLCGRAQGSGRHYGNWWGFATGERGWRPRPGDPELEREGQVVRRSRGWAKWKLLLWPRRSSLFLSCQLHLFPFSPHSQASHHTVLSCPRAFVLALESALNTLLVSIQKHCPLFSQADPTHPLDLSLTVGSSERPSGSQPLN